MKNGGMLNGMLNFIYTYVHKNKKQFLDGTSWFILNYSLKLDKSFGKEHSQSFKLFQYSIMYLMEHVPKFILNITS